MRHDFQKLLGELERFGISGIGHGQTGLKQHLQGTAEILQRWGCAPELVRAGLCHSIYGTESFLQQPATLENRSFVREQIGQEAERLAYCFGAHEKETLWKNLTRADSFRIGDRFTGESEAVSAEELASLLTLTLANWLEQRARAGAEHRNLRKDEFLRAKDFLPAPAYEEFLQAYGLAPVYKKKVVAYIVRGKELLVFDHVHFPAAGTQVPAGTMDGSETPEEALLREVEEESGLVFREPGRMLGKFRWFRADANELHLRHVFHLEAQAGISDSFSHKIKSHDDDDGLELRYFWIPLAEAADRLAGSQGAYL